MRRPVVSFATAALTALGMSCASQAQNSEYATFVPRLIASAGYSFVYTNDPPGGAHKFDINGGFVSVDYNIRHWLGVSGEFTGGQATQISPIGQNLRLYTYTFGPRFAWRPPGRFTVFGQVLTGRAEGTNSYFPTATSYTTSAAGLAGSVGGGISYRLTHRYSFRGDVRYLHTTFNNGVNSSENQLEFNGGIAIKFGGHYLNERPRQAAFPHAEPLPAPLPDPVPPPPAPALEATQVPDPAPVAAPSVDTPHDTTSDDGIHPPVDDIYFDNNNSDLPEDRWISFRQAVLYLQTHPGQRLLLGGYSDERGTVEFNMELGEKRATGVRAAMIHLGANPDQITVVTYGRGAQVCTTPAEPCYQRNRRVSFMWIR